MEKHDGIKVSVIVPVYNTARYLEQCLNSILNQTLKEFEIICVNDGSTDDSAKILEKYSQKDKRIVVINQENAGVSVARNAGLNCAKGRYIAFVDSDDYIKKNFLEVLYTTAVSTEADITACDIIYEKDGRLISNNYMSRQTFKVKEPVFSTNQDKARFVKSRVIYNKIYKSELINKNNIRFVPGVQFGEDTYFLFIASMFASSIALTRHTAYYYRKNQASVSYEAFNSEIVFDLIKSLDNINSYIGARPLDDKKKTEYFNLFHSFAINMFYAWCKEVAEPYKTKFKSMVEERLKRISLENNDFVDSKTRRRYEKLTGTYESFWNKLAIFR